MPSWSCSRQRASITTTLRRDSTPGARWSASGGSDSSRRAWPAWRNDRAAADRRAFPPSLAVEVKAIACELPAALGLPLSRLQVPDIRAEVLRRGLVAEISETTIWRWLSDDAIAPWRHRSWIFPRDPDFEASEIAKESCEVACAPSLLPFVRRGFQFRAWTIQRRAQRHEPVKHPCLRWPVRRSSAVGEWPLQLRCQDGESGRKDA